VPNELSHLCSCSFEQRRPLQCKSRGAAGTLAGRSA